MNSVLLILLSVAFAVTHIGMSTDPFRSNAVDKLGEMGFRGIYSLVSFITFGGAIWFFMKAQNTGPELWTLPWYLALCPGLLMLIAIPLIVFGYAQPGPAGMMPGSYEVKGMKKITRHPANMGVGLLGLAHVLANPHLSDVAFFGSIFVVGFFGVYHQDIRKSRELGEEYEKYKSETSIFPFGAILSRKTKFEMSELSKPLLLISLLAYVALIIFHGKLFGEGVF